MKFKTKNLNALAECVVGDAEFFEYRSSFYITEFFDDCGIPFVHDGSTRRIWASDRLAELLKDPTPQQNILPARFVRVLQVLMDKTDAVEGDDDRDKALAILNKPLLKEGFEAYFDDSGVLQVRHTGTKTVSISETPHRPLSPAEVERREKLSAFLDDCSEDQLIEEVLMPLFRQLGFQRISVAGHKDKSLEYGKDIWMRFVLPTQHVLYFGVQVKKGKLDAAGMSKGSNKNIAEILNQVVMMLGHEVFDPEVSRRVLVDHAFIVAGGEITKQARNWLGGKLDASKRSQILFMDRDDILDQFVVSALPLPADAEHGSWEEFPF